MTPREVLCRSVIALRATPDECVRGYIIKLPTADEGARGVIHHHRASRDPGRMRPGLHNYSRSRQLDPAPIST